MPKKSKGGGDVLVDAAKAAIDEVFSDTSVSQEETLERMQEILSTVQGNIDAIKADLKQDD